VEGMEMTNSRTRWVYFQFSGGLGELIGSTKIVLSNWSRPLYLGAWSRISSHLLSV
jgi:hypothetical protein